MEPRPEKDRGLLDVPVVEVYTDEAYRRKPWPRTPCWFKILVFIWVVLVILVKIKKG